MERHRVRRKRRGGVIVALFAVLALVAAGCADDDDGDGGAEDTEAPAEEEESGEIEVGAGSGSTVTMTGPEVEVEGQALVDAFDAFTEQTGIEIQYQGTRDFEAQIGVRVDGGDPPDVAMFPQPGRIREFAEEGALVPLAAEPTAEVQANMDPQLVELVTIDGQVYGIPAKADLKSLVWYSPDAFEEAGYAVPQTFDEFLALSDQMIENGDTAFCVGIESGEATGWPMTDWIEDFVLRTAGPDFFEQWVNNEVPFDSPEAVAAAQQVIDLWETEGAVFGGTQNIAATAFADAGLPLLEGDCMMHRQGNFYFANWPEGTDIGADGEVNAFYLPGSAEFPNITLTGGIYAAAFNDRPEVQQVMQFIASPDFANARVENQTGGYLSPNRNQDVTLYPSEIEQTFASILAQGTPLLFDADDRIGGEGQRTWWEANVDIVTGDESVDDAFATVDDALSGN
jgi:alpha-glucoside transport system substrate-binding protein